MEQYSFERKIVRGTGLRLKVLTILPWGSMAEIGLACCLLFTGLVHFGNGYFFLSSILSYKLVPVFIAKQLAITLPLLHIVISLLLLGDFQKTTALSIAVLLFSSYLFAQGSAFLRGIQIDCGCFGVDSHQIGVVSMLKVSILMIVTLAILFHELKEGKGEHR